MYYPCSVLSTPNLNSFSYPPSQSLNPSLHSRIIPICEFGIIPPILQKYAVDDELAFATTGKSLNGAGSEHVWVHWVLFALL